MCFLTFDDLFAHKIYHHTYQDQLINFFSFFLSLKTILVGISLTNFSEWKESFQSLLRMKPRQEYIFQMRIFLIIFIILIKYMELEKLLYLLREAGVDCLGAKVLWIMGSNKMLPPRDENEAYDFLKWEEM